MNVEQIKLVIWDLDDTLWNGTISEGPIERVQRNHHIVVTLAERGIISSICSKNDHDIAIAELQAMGLDDYMVLPSIDWTPKGPRIARLIDELNLRPVNVLFIDDLAKNLEEARFALPQLNVALPDILDTLLDEPALAGKPDPRLKRLAQYKVIEHKIAEKSNFAGDATEFLRQSEITVAVLPPTEDDIERLEDLINRSNQLNFTKRRVDPAAVRDYVNSTSAETGAVWVSDKYGDYGLAGFYALNNGRLSQFTFSCRILGLGVENWLFQRLGRPELEIVGDVSSELGGDGVIDWITEVDQHRAFVESTTATERLIIKGGCDLRQLKGYLRADVIKDEEMNYVTLRGFEAHNEHTEILKRANLDFVTKFADVIEQIPFVDEETFETRFVDDSHRFKLYSVLMDYTQGLYRFRDTDFVIPRGSFSTDLTKTNYLERRFGHDFATWFIENFRFEGVLSPAAFEANLEWMVSTVPPAGRLILLNGAEVVSPSEKEANRHLHHRTYNDIVDAVAARHDNVSVIDVREIVTDSSKVTNNIRHYTRDVYQELAKRVDDILLNDGIALRDNVIPTHESKRRKGGTPPRLRAKAPVTKASLADRIKGLFR